MESMEDRASHTHPKPKKPTNNSQFPSASMKDSVLKPIPILPAELITEILSRVPVKSLVKFRSVSKSWLALISSPEFINTHLTLSTNNNKDYTHHWLGMNFRAAKNGLHQYKLQGCTVSSLLYESVAEEFDLDYPCKVLHDHFSVVGSVNGLICLVIEEYELVLWNPSIRKYKKLPVSIPAIRNKDFRPIYGFGYDKLHDDYKVVAFFQNLAYMIRLRSKYIVYGVILGKVLMNVQLRIY